MLTLALDVDGVLLDSDRGGAGHWSNELSERFGIERERLREAFFVPHWADVVTGRRPVEEPLAQALADMGSEVSVQEVLQCWFEADYVPIEPSFELARRVAGQGHRIVLATNQEHRRARYLGQRIGAVLPLSHVFYSADLAFPKDDQRFFANASEQLGLANQQLSSVVFVDDTLSNVEAACSFGWQGIHATAGGAWRHEVSQRFGSI